MDLSKKLYHPCCGSEHSIRFKEYRKLIGRVIGTRGSMVKFYPVLDYQANMFLKRVLENPSAFDEVSIYLILQPRIHSHLIIKATRK